MSNESLLHWRCRSAPAGGVRGRTRVMRRSNAETDLHGKQLRLAGGGSIQRRRSRRLDNNEIFQNRLRGDVEKVLAARGSREEPPLGTAALVIHCHAKRVTSGIEM